MIACDRTLELPGLDIGPIPSIAQATGATKATVAPAHIPDLSRLVRYEVITDGQRWRVGGIGGVRSGEVGKAIAIIALKHVGGYEIVLRFDDGKVDSFSPMSLYPDLEAA